MINLLLVFTLLSVFILILVMYSESEKANKSLRQKILLYIKNLENNSSDFHSKNYEHLTYLLKRSSFGLALEDVNDLKRILKVCKSRILQPVVQDLLTVCVEKMRYTSSNSGKTYIVAWLSEALAEEFDNPIIKSKCFDLLAAIISSDTRSAVNFINHWINNLLITSSMTSQNYIINVPILCKELNCEKKGEELEWEITLNYIYLELNNDISSKSNMNFIQKSLLNEIKVDGFKIGKYSISYNLNSLTKLIFEAMKKGQSKIYVNSTLRTLHFIHPSLKGNFIEIQEIYACLININSLEEMLSEEVVKIQNVLDKLKSSELNKYSKQIDDYSLRYNSLNYYHEQLNYLRNKCLYFLKEHVLACYAANLKFEEIKDSKSQWGEYQNLILEYENITDLVKKRDSVKFRARVTQSIDPKL